MLFLADENFPRLAVLALRNAGYDTKWVKTEVPGIPDEEVMMYAYQEKRILLTFDKDFGELVFKKGKKENCGIILFRIPTHSPEEAAQMVVSTIKSRTDWEEHFSVVKKDHIRIRPLLFIV
jgi:predicted nuclease of predicted toxin-antitoxin system